MVLGIITYIIILIIAFYMGIAYLEVFPTILVAILLMIPILLIILAFIQSLGLKVTFGRLGSTLTTSEKCNLKIRVKNGFLLPIIKGQIRLRFSYVQTNGTFVTDLPFSVRGSASSVLTYSFVPEYAGTLNVQVVRIRVMDLFGILPIGFKRSKKAYSMVVLPNMHPIAITDKTARISGLIIDEQGGDVRGNEKKGNPFYKDRTGDDPSEVYRIREYIQGDKLSRTDWKTSARLGKTMVKDYSCPIIDGTVIAVDLNFINQEDFHRRLEVALSLCLSILNTDNYLSIMWFDARTGGFEQHHVEKDDDLYEVTGMLSGASAIPAVKLSEICENISQSGNLRQLFYVTGSLPEEDKNFCNTDGKYRINVISITEEDFGCRELSGKNLQFNLSGEYLTKDLDKLQVVIY